MFVFRRFPDTKTLTFRVKGAVCVLPYGPGESSGYIVPCFVMMVMCYLDANRLEKAGWIHIQDVGFSRKWKQTWLTVSTDGFIHCHDDKEEKKPKQTFDLKNELVLTRKSDKCTHMLPPPGLGNECLMEFMFMGSRVLTLCAESPSDAQEWLAVIELASSDKSLPSSRKQNGVVTEDTDNRPVLWCCCFRKNTTEVNTFNNSS